MGGYIAWQFVRKYAARLRALVLLDTRSLADTDEARAGRIKMAENVAEWGSGRVAEMMGPKLVAPSAFEKKPTVVTALRRVVAEHVTRRDRRRSTRPGRPARYDRLPAANPRAHARHRRRPGCDQPARRNESNRRRHSRTQNSSSFPTRVT